MSVPASLRERLAAVGLLGPASGGGLRIVEGPCPSCGQEQNLALPHDAPALCITCNAPLEPKQST